MKFCKNLSKISKFVFILFIIFIPSTTLASIANYAWSNIESLTLETSANIGGDYIEDNSNPLNLDCGSCILIEQTTGQILYSYNSHEKLRPASVTKLMSILLIMEALECGKITYETNIPCSQNAASMGGSQIWLDTTETLSVEEMLKAICVVSANDCVVAMAEYIGGTEEGFVQMMNEKAKELGMEDTTFKNCHGIDEDDHVTSSYDIALMSKELLNKYPQIINYTTIWSDSLRNGESELINTNKLVHNYNGCTGLKTGSTSLALYNLCASATRDDLSLIAVVMKAPTSALRFNNAKALLDYGFTNFQFEPLANQGDIVQTINIEKGTKSTINAVFENSSGTLVSKGNSININKTISINDNIFAPISKGDVIGSVSFSLNDEIIGSVNLVSDADVQKLSLWSMSGIVFQKWLNLLRV